MFGVANIRGAPSWSSLFEVFQHVAATVLARGAASSRWIITSSSSTRAGTRDPSTAPITVCGDTTTELAMVRHSTHHSSERHSRRSVTRSTRAPGAGLRGLLPTDAHDIDALLELNRRADLLVEESHVVQCLPSERENALLANLPDGYFEGGWNPFQLRAVVTRIRERHGYVLAGIGCPPWHSRLARTLL
ncbi:hypothetical protein ABIQ69_00040 [Agromyces sp. G08B096]|uniref:Uncharacterized protein n=1 Tax=Agromyces sp. G08B096 TaxID=3156399 RepID=A0AAU7W7A0_9MICO